MTAEQLKKRSQWQDVRKIKRAFLPDNTVNNLYDTRSLTDKVKAVCEKCDNTFSVVVINETEQKPTINEQQHLRMRHGLYARIREIYLCCGEKKIIYARSIIPISTLGGRQRQIKFLRNRSLGSYLFSDRTLKRKITQIAKAQLRNDTVWGRRSVFYVDHKPLIVAEWFLEDL